MPNRSQATFAKRQREVNKRAKKAEKQAKRAARRAEPPTDPMLVTTEEEVVAQPDAT